MKVLGKDVLVLIFYNSAWRNYACATDCSLDVTTDFIETSSKGNGKSKTFLPTTDEFTGSINGLISLQDVLNMSLPDFRDIQDTQQSLLMRYQHTDISGNVYTEECTFYISKTTSGGSFDGVATFSVELRGTGKRTRIYTTTATTNLPIMRLEYTGVGGEVSFTDPILIGKNVIGAWKDGIGNSKIITAGTPINKEVLINNTTGYVEWAIPFDVGEEAFLLYQ